MVDYLAIQTFKLFTSFYYTAIKFLCFSSMFCWG